MSKLHERVALVTGGGRGIGRAIAVALGREGARVAVSARTASELEEVCAAIRTARGQALPVAADLAQPGATDHVLKQVAAHFGPIEILVNNAGVGSSANPKPVVNFDD